MNQNAYFSIVRHANKLLLVTFSGMTAGIGPSFQTHGRTHGTTDGWTDRCGSRNSYLDYFDHDVIEA